MHRSQQHHPMVDIMQYQLEASIHLANAVFSSTERIDRAVLDVTHEAVDRQLKIARAATDFRDPSKAAELQVAMSGQPEKAIHCQQEIMAALAEVQAEFGKSVRSCMEKCTELATARVTETGAEARTALPEGVTSNPFFSMMSVWEQAFRQASQLASQNMLVASSSAESAANLAREAVTAASEAVSGSDHVHHEAHADEEHSATRRHHRRK
jgi:hypothetical protein